MTAGSVRAEFETKAVIDWIELAVTLAKGTQFRYVQDSLIKILDLTDTPYVTPEHAGAGGVATRFLVRFHDAHVATLQTLADIMAELALAHQFAAPPEITAIEVAVDFYSRTEPNAVVPLVHRLQLSISAHGNPRQFDPDKAQVPKRCVRFLNPNRVEPVTGLVIDPSLNLRIGNSGDAVQWQVYDKRTDFNRRPIEASKRRGRAEFTLTGQELAKYVLGYQEGAPPRLARLNDLQTFRFESLAELLHFRKFKPIEEIAKNPVALATLTRLRSWRAYGITNYPLGFTACYRDCRRPAEIGRTARLKYSRHTMADAELNDIVRRTLKALSKRFA